MVSYNLALRQVSMGAAVLILVVVEDGLVPPNPYFYGNSSCVLILVVVEDGLVLKDFKMTAESLKSLNPCCSGRWSRTRPYKTMLIINKLKNKLNNSSLFLTEN